MILEATSKEDFAVKLISACVVDTRMNFESKVSKIKELGSIDPKFYRNDTGGITNTFDGNPFDITPVKLYDHKINRITTQETFYIAISHGVERLVRSMFRNQQVRKLLEILVKGDTQLINAIQNARIINSSWAYNYNPQTKFLNKQVCCMFPFSYEKHNKSLWVNESIAEEYTAHQNMCILLFSYIFSEAGLCIPIGNYDIIDTFQTSANKNNYEIVDGKETEFLSYQLIPDVNSFKPFAEETIVEKVFNAGCGVVYNASPLLLQRLEAEIYENSSNCAYVGKILKCLLSMMYDGKSTIFEGIRLINMCLSGIGIKLDEYITSVPMTVRNKIFFNIIRRLNTRTLFILSEHHKLTVLDEFGVMVNDPQTYILKVLIERFRKREELDITLRNFLNDTSDVKDMLRVLEVFHKNYPVVDSVYN